MSDFKEKKFRTQQKEQQQQKAQESLSKRKAPTSIKQQRRETVAEAIASNYRENLKSLLEIQKIINKMFVEHPIYQEYHRRSEVAKLYKELYDQQMRALENVNKLHRVADKQYSDWLKLVSRLEKKNLTLKDKIKLWFTLKFRF